MKLATVIIATKGTCVVGGTALLSYQTAIGQWANTDQFPSGLEWSMIIGGAIGTGLVALGGFLSSSFGKYVQANSDVDISAATVESPKQ